MPARPVPTAEGHFAKTPFAHVLLYMRERTLTGTLAIECGQDGGELQGETLITFAGGAVTQARMPAILDPLGSVLVEQGAITAEQLHESSTRMTARMGLQGEILLSLGACDAAAIDRGLREQLRRKLVRFFAVDNASYQYFDAIDLLRGYGGARNADDVFAVLWRGVRSHPAQKMLDSVLARVGANALRVRANATDLARFEFEPAEQRIVDRLRAEPTAIEPLVRAAGDSRVIRALLYVLIITKQVEAVAARAAAADGAARVSSPSLASAPPRAREPARTSVEPPAQAVSAPPRAAEPSRVSVETPARAVSAPPSRPSVASQRAAVPADLKPKLDEAESRLAAMDDENYFEMLNVPTSASQDAINAAFLELAARWHPDRVPTSIPPLREAYHKIFAYVTEARDTLCNDLARGRYLGTVQDGGGTPNSQRKIALMIEAATDAQKAEVCLRRREYDEGERLARRALAISADDPNALAVLAALLMERTIDSAPPDEAARLLLRATTLAPNHDRAHTLLGMFHKRRGNTVEAARHFRAAVEANPKNMDAQREVRLADMRSRNSHAPSAPSEGSGGDDKSKKSDGIFSKFLKR